MEFGTREILIISGIVVIFGILLHGFRSVRHSRNGSIKVGRRKQGIFDDDGFDDLPGELLTGEVRVTKRDEERLEEVSDSIKRSWERNADRKTSAFRERYERSGNVIPFQNTESARPQPKVEEPRTAEPRREWGARRATRDTTRDEDRPQYRDVYREDVVAEPVAAVEQEIQVSLDEFEIRDEYPVEQPQADIQTSQYSDQPMVVEADDDDRLFDDNYEGDILIDDNGIDDRRTVAPRQEQPAVKERSKWGRRDTADHREEPLVARRDDEPSPAARRDSQFRLEPAEAKNTQRRKPFWEEAPPPQPEPVQVVEPEPEPPRGPSVAQTEVVVLHVMAKNGAPIAGKDLLEALLANDLRYGSMQIFHRHLHPDGSGPVLFSLANSVKPGIFDLSAMDNFSTPGVSLFMALDGLDHPLEAYKELIKTAQNLAKALNGNALDETRSVLTKQTIEHYRQQIIDFTRRSFTLTH